MLRCAIKGKSDARILLMEEILDQLIGSLSHASKGLIDNSWCRISSINGIFKSQQEHLHKNQGTNSTKT